MRILRFLETSLLSACALALSLCLGLQSVSGRAAGQGQPTLPADARVEDIEQRIGPFAIAGQNYAVVLHEKRLPSVGDPTFAHTLAGVEISDTTGNVSYQEAFACPIEQGRFRQNLSASAELVSGKTGAGLVIHYGDVWDGGSVDRDLARLSDVRHCDGREIPTSASCRRAMFF